GVHTMRLTPGAAPAPTPVSDGSTDERVAFTADGRVAFTRWDDAGAPYIYLASADGLSITRALPRPRLLMTGNLASGKILVASNDGRFLYWWDPATGREENAAIDAGDVTHLVMSPNGKWMMRQFGRFGQTVERARADAAHPTWERIHDGAVGEVMTRCAIADDGTVIGA